MDIINKCTTYISIGSNCHVKKFIDYHYGKQSSLFFDNLGSSMKGVVKCFKDDFKNFFVVDHFTKYHSLKQQSTGELTNRYYNFIVAHEVRSLCTQQRIDDFFNKMMIKKEKLFDEINNNEHILLVRYEEDFDNRIINDGNNPDLKYVYELLDFIKNKYKSKKFYVLYFSVTLKNQIDEINNVIIVNIEKDVKYKNAEIIMENAIKLFNIDNS